MIIDERVNSQNTSSKPLPGHGARRGDPLTALGISNVSIAPPLTPSRSPVVCAGLVVADHLCPPLDHLPRAGELVTVDELVLNIGGGAANTAVDLARLGVTAKIRARVGDDIFGRFATETLRAHNVDTSALKIDPELATSQTLIVNVRGQDRRFIHCVGANAGLCRRRPGRGSGTLSSRAAHRLLLDPAASRCRRACRAICPRPPNWDHDRPRRRHARTW